MDISALFKIGYGLYVLTARENEFDNGCIVNTVSQLTSSPAQVSVAVNKANKTHDMIYNTGLFNASMLTENVPFDIFKHFGFASGKDTDKFAGFSDMQRSGNGLYFIDRYTNAYISGRVIQTVDVGTHTLFIADVTDCSVLSSETSVTYDYYFKNIKPQPAAVKKTCWRCRICGYIYEGDELPEDFVCPICKHGAADFEKIEVS